jgi:WD40 repeat protein
MFCCERVVLSHSISAEAPQYEAVALDVSAHHRIYSVGRDDHRIRCWDPYDNSCLRIYQGCEGASCFLYSQPHARLVTGHEDGTVRLWNPDAGSCVRLLPVGGQHGALPWGSTRQRQLENMISCCTLGRLQKGGRERQLLTGDYVSATTLPHRKGGGGWDGAQEHRSKGSNGRALRCSS